MVHLVALLEAAQDRDRVLDRGLAHEDRLEAALEGRVLLDVLAVLVEGGGADAAQLAARQGGLEHVGRVGGALGRAGAHDGVQLVDEEDDLALGLGDLAQHRLEAVLELAAVLGCPRSARRCRGIRRRSFRALGHVARHDALGEPLGDGGLAHAGLADQHRVVLRAPREHLDRRGGSPRRVPPPGRSCPRATSVRSRPNFASAWYFDSGSGSVTRAPPRTEARAFHPRRLLQELLELALEQVDGHAELLEHGDGAALGLSSEAREVRGRGGSPRGLARTPGTGPRRGLPGS